MSVHAEGENKKVPAFVLLIGERDKRTGQFI